jgi:hypothetical protein
MIVAHHIAGDFRHGATNRKFLWKLTIPISDGTKIKNAAAEAAALLKVAALELDPDAQL